MIYEYVENEEIYDSQQDYENEASIKENSTTITKQEMKTITSNLTKQA